MSQTVITKITAAFKYPAGKPIMKALKPGDDLKLVREPTNAFDPNAIKVMGFTPAAENEEVDLVQLGYVPAPVAAQLKHAKFTSCKKSGAAWDEITIEIA